MGFFRVYPDRDNWITDKSPDGDNTTRASGSNHGRSPALNIFADKHAIVSGSNERARILMHFDLTELSGKIYSDLTVPSSSVTYVLRAFNMRHDETVPSSYNLFAYPLLRSWDEGTGIDDDKMRDLGWSNWLSASSTQGWTTTGSDFYDTPNYGSGTQHFDPGYEDLEIDFSSVVVNWLTGSLVNNGILIKLGATEENNDTAYFKKIFHGRETKFVEKLPYLEARWNDVVKDNRNNFSYDQNNKLYFYNFVRGELTAVTEPIYVRIQDHIVAGVSGSASFNTTLTGSKVATGIYSASLNVVSTASFSSSWHDIWHSGAYAYMTGTFLPRKLTGSQVDPYNEFTVNITNLRRVYDTREEARLKVNVRKRDWKTHVGVVASASADLGQQREYIEKMYYSIVEENNGAVIIPFATGSVAYTQLSYNADGNYFNINMNAFVPGHLYRILFLIDINQYDKKLIDENIIFKVV